MPGGRVAKTPFSFLPAEQSGQICDTVLKDAVGGVALRSALMMANRPHKYQCRACGANSRKQSSAWHRSACWTDFRNWRTAV